MSDPIVNTLVVNTSSAKIKAGDVLGLIPKFEEAELEWRQTFVGILSKSAEKAPTPDTYLKIETFAWYCEGGGYYWNNSDLFTDCISCIQGTLKLIVIWESGGVGSLLVEDGVVKPSKPRLSVVRSSSSEDEDEDRFN